MLKAFLFFLATYFSWWAELALKRFPDDFSDIEKSSLISKHFKLDNRDFVAFVEQEKLWERGWEIFIRLIAYCFREESLAIAKQYKIKLKTSCPEITTLGCNECYLYATPNPRKHPGGWSYGHQLEFMIKDAVGNVIAGEIDGYSFDSGNKFWGNEFWKLVGACQSGVAEIKDDLKSKLFEVLLGRRRKRDAAFLQNAAVHQPIISNDTLGECLLYAINHYQNEINQIGSIGKSQEGIEVAARSGVEQSFLDTIDFLIGDPERAQGKRALVEAVLVSPVWKLLYTGQKIDVILANWSDKDFYSFVINNKDTIGLVDVLTNGGVEYNDTLELLARHLYKRNYFDPDETSKLQSKWPNFLSDSDDNAQASHHDSIFLADDLKERERKEKAELCDAARNYLKNNIDIYEEFHISNEATKEEINKAYYKLARIYNPNCSENKEKFQEIANIKEVLLDPDAKIIYDAGYSDKSSPRI